MTPSSTSHDIHAIHNNDEQPLVIASKNNAPKPNDKEPGVRESYSIMMNLPDHQSRYNDQKSFQQTAQDFHPLTLDTETERDMVNEASNRLLVEIELGQQAMPKPLLSGYFTN